MNNQTGKLGLPYILPAQAQKHITHNEGLQILDAVIQLTLQSLDVSALPGFAEDGQAWYITPSASGAWEGHDNEIALWQSGTWQYLKPKNGWRAWVEDISEIKVWDNGAWHSLQTQTQNLPHLGINSTANATNRLNLSSSASLFNHEGTGHQLKINKQAPAHTGSIIFQTGFSGRAEMGVAGTDDFQIKVSPDGDNWQTAIRVSANSGDITFPNAQNDKIMTMLKFGDYASSNNGTWYRLCEWKTGGNYNTTTAIFDISHRASFTFQTLKVRFEKRTHGFVSCEMKAEGDSFQDGEEYLLVLTDADAKATLYHKRAAGHYTERYMSMRHMWKVNAFTSFQFAEQPYGANEPIGDLEAKIL